MVKALNLLLKQQDEISKSEITDWSKKPDIILSEGILESSISGGNHTISFKKGNFKYIVYRYHVRASETPEISLSVEENNKEIINEDGQLLEK